MHNPEVRDHPIAPGRGLANLHPAILAARGDALRRIRAYALPLALVDGVQVYFCPQCQSTSKDPGFAVWHDRSTCMEVALA